MHYMCLMLSPSQSIIIPEGCACNDVSTNPAAQKLAYQAKLISWVQTIKTITQRSPYWSGLGLSLCQRWPSHNITHTHTQSLLTISHREGHNSSRHPTIPRQTRILSGVCLYHNRLWLREGERERDRVKEWRVYIIIIIITMFMPPDLIGETSPTNFVT